MTDPVVSGAFEHQGRPVDRSRFYAIACDPRRSAVVEACAGAGKTWMLVSRILRALLDGAEPQDILAITFTKKAAAEMRQRLLQWLQEFALAPDAELTEALRVRGVSGEISPAQISSLRFLHERLLSAGRPVQIRTFHSWFAALLRGAPVAVLEALQLPTRYELLEDDTQAIALVWRQLYVKVDSDAALRKDFFASVATFGRHQTLQALHAALQKRSEFALADMHGVVDSSVQAFGNLFPDLAGFQEPALALEQDAIRGHLWDAAKALGACNSKTCQKSASALELALTRRDIPTVFAALLTQNGTPRALKDKALDTEKVQTAQDLLLRVQSAMDQHAAWLHHHRLARLARALLAEFAGLKRQRGWVDMGDLERTAQMLMSDPQLSGWMQERLDSRVRHLLIDEFQDTNPLQWQTLSAWLSGYSGAAVAPSVFIVGDPKQSIYRFRRAEPQVFEAAKRFVTEGLAGDLLSCDHTRRNARSVVAVVNAVMQEAQSEGLYAGFRAHTTESAVAGNVWSLPRIERGRKTAVTTEEVAEHPVPDGGSVSWRDSLTTPRHTEEETRKTREVRQAAAWMATQLRESKGALQAHDIMVLTRKRERLALMQAELIALGIPAQQPEKNDLGDLPEVQDVIALLDCLVSTSHDLSLARVLKSPIVGLQDIDLVQIVVCQRRMTAAGQPAPGWWVVLQKGKDLPSGLQRAAATLERWRQWVQQLPPHDALSLIFDDGDVLARYAAVAPDALREAMLAHLRAVLHAALQFNGGRYATPYALVRALRAGGNPAPVQAQANAVRLLTIHGAKGLEAPLVLMLDTDAEAQKSESMGVLVQWPGEDAYPRKFVFLASETKPPLCAAETLAQEKQARDREELNALYVAITRTQSTLAISAVEPHHGSMQSWWQRLLPHAIPADMGSGETSLGEEAVSASSVQSGVQEQRISIQVLPIEAFRAVATEQQAQAATVLVANADLPESLESRMGQAMHRLLEWFSPETPWTDAQLRSVAFTFTLEQEQAKAACTLARGIVQGEGAWAWDPQALLWQANEVALNFQGQLLRLDRLVQRRDSGAWWVLDFKSNQDPMASDTLRMQLARYRTAVQRIYPDHPVRAAFLTPQGRLMELEQS